MTTLLEFVRESNRIEGILRDPTDAEIAHTGDFIGSSTLAFADVLLLQSVYAPGKPIRNKAGMDVFVGRYVPPPGGPLIVTSLKTLILDIKMGMPTPWAAHVAFEKLHPFMDGNGRTGRALWAWHMRKVGQDPFALPFLHRWYYQTLAAQQ